MKLQIDRLDSVARLSFGEFWEVVPDRTSLVFPALTKVLDFAGGWQAGRSVLVAHSADHPPHDARRRIVSLQTPRGLGSRPMILSEVRRREDLADAIACGWQMPRLLLLVGDERLEERLRQTSAKTWDDIFTDEVPTHLLGMSPSAVVFGFYHQEWISAFVPIADAVPLAKELLATLPGTTLVEDAF